MGGTANKSRYRIAYRAPNADSSRDTAKRRESRPGHGSSPRRRETKGREPRDRMSARWHIDSTPATAENPLSRDAAGDCDDRPGRKGRGPAMTMYWIYDL